jgi:hypothetical protein
MVFKIGHKYLINLNNNILYQIDLVNNVVKDGIIIFHLQSLKIHGHKKNRINCLNYTVNKEINGNKFQRIFTEGILINFIIELTMI